MTFWHVAASVPVAPISSDSLFLLLLQVAVLLFAALLLGALARRYGLPSIVGELSAGILLGPSLFGWVWPEAFSQLFPPVASQMHLLDAIGQIGVIMLVGLSGMELNVRLLRKQGSAAVRISLAGLIIPFGLGLGLGYILPDSFVPAGIDRLIFALFIGVALCVSAIPVIAKTLMDLNLIKHRIGQLALTAGIIDDIVGWIILSVIAGLVTVGSFDLSGLSQTIVLLGLFIGAAMTVGRFLVRQVLQFVRRSSSDDGPTVTAIAAIIILMAAITHAMHLEAVFGAFVAGLLIRSDINFKKIALPTVLSILAPIFFATAGLRMDLTALARPSVLLGALALLGVAIVGKFGGAFIGGRLSRLSGRESLALGAAMNARGVIEVVIASVGVRLGVLGTEAYTAIVLVAIVTSLIAPPMLRWLLQPDHAG